MGKINVKDKFAKLGLAIKNGIAYIKKFWNVAPEGRYIPIKEAVAYCIGGIGVSSIGVVAAYYTLAQGIYYAAAFQITPDEIYLISVITSIITILRAPLYSSLIDNSRTKFGKFRPFLIYMPIPIAICSFMFALIPMIAGGNHLLVIIVFTIIFNLFQFFLGLYTTAFTMIIQVITPNQKEKEWLMSFGAFVYSLGPSIVNFIYPLLANYIYTQKGAGGIDPTTGKPIDILGVHTQGPYQWLLPCIMVLCLIFGYILAMNVKERTIVSKKVVQKVPFKEGLSTTVKNKYFWLYNASVVGGVLKLLGSGFVVWVCSYLINEKWAQSIFVTLMGSACVPGMILAPLLIRKFGKRNLALFSNVFVAVMTIIVVLACIIRTDASPWILILASFLITLVNSVQIVLLPAQNTQVLDYQQYKSGKRMEGFISQLGVILLTAVSIGTTAIQPAIQKAFGYTGDATVLYDKDVIYPIIMWCGVVAIASALIAALPFVFWSMTDRRHEDIIEILKVRKMHEDEEIDDELCASLEERLEAGEHKALSEYLESIKVAQVEETPEVACDTI